MFFDGYVSFESTMNCTVVLLPIGNQDDFDCYVSAEGTMDCICSTVADWQTIFLTIIMSFSDNYPSVCARSV